jgi:8-oxo-dGTP pyrophosphatase MutT (NUDIX family)
MPRENGTDEIEVHVATLCLEERDGVLKILIGKRAANRKIYPGLWECGGGQVRKGQTFQDAVKAQMKDEFGLEADVLFPLGDYAIETEGKLIPGMRYVCRPRAGQTIRLNPVELVDYKWVTLADLPAHDTIPGLAADIQQAYEWFNRFAKGI